MIIPYAGILILSFLLSLAFTRFFIWLSFKVHFLDVPHTIARKNHQKSTPLLGGPAVFLSFFISLYLALGLAFLFHGPLVSFFPFLAPLIQGAKTQCFKLSLILLGGGLILLLGLKDDKDGIGPGIKLGGLLLIALLLFYLKVRISLFFPGHLINFFLTMAWIIFLTNSFNLLDNMDGLSAGTATACSVSLLVCSLMLSQYLVSLYLLAFIGALLGFLRYNMAGGKIFLGDSGALFTGFNLAAAAILETYYISGQSHVAAVFIPAFVFVVPFYDTLSVIVIRIKNGKPVYKGDLNHFSHRLNRSGYSKRDSVLIIIALSLITGVSSVYILNWEKISVAEAIGFFVSIVLVLWMVESFIKQLKAVGATGRSS